MHCPDIVQSVHFSDQRDERLGWMGDAGLSADTMTINFQVAALHENFLRNIEDELDASTFSLPDTVWHPPHIVTQ